MIYRNVQSNEFYRLLRPVGSYPDPQYDYWALWQPVRKLLGLIWVKDGEPFWLDMEGFFPLEGIEMFAQAPGFRHAAVQPVSPSEYGYPENTHEC